MCISARRCPVLAAPARVSSTAHPIGAAPGRAIRAKAAAGFALSVDDDERILKLFEDNLKPHDARRAS
jgi:hypothetical protein